MVGGGGKAVREKDIEFFIIKKKNKQTRRKK